MQLKCIGGFKGAKGGGAPPNVFLAVIQVKHLAEQLLCPLCLARPPKIF